MTNSRQPFGQDADEQAHREAIALIDALRSGAATSAALGLWTQSGVPLNSDWIESLPPGTFGTITDQAALDDWCSQATGGQITEFPLSLTPQAPVILASALAIKTRWQQRFADGVHRATSGPWADRSFPSLHRSSADLTTLVVSECERPLTRAIIAGEDDVDVHLLIADEHTSAADVLRRGLDPTESVRDGTMLRPGDRAQA